MHPEEVCNKKLRPVTLDYRLFVKTYFPNIMMTKNQDQATGENSSPASKATIKDVLLELMEVSKTLQETITTSTVRKRNMDGLIKMLSKEKEGEEEKEADGE